MSIITFYICASFSKPYVSWLNFKIIMQATNEVFRVFCLKEILLDSDTF